MLIQLPRGSAQGLPSEKSQTDESFEAGLRRDLASAPVVSYDSVIGGWQKRATDLVVTILTAPLWAPLMALAGIWAKPQNGSSRLLSEERVGYGGRVFRCYRFQLAPQSAVVTALHPEKSTDMTTIAENAEKRIDKWRHTLEHLPRLINVLRGEMSLVGPEPLSREQLDPLKIAKRYYLSARPGVIDVAAVTDNADSSQYKIYALSWSLTLDALIARDALSSLRKRGELWRPALLRAVSAETASQPNVRNRAKSDAA